MSRVATHLYDSTGPTLQTVAAFKSSIVAAVGTLTDEDIDTLAELNAILGDATLVDQSRQVIAGTGLSGGGTLAADRAIQLSTANIDKLATVTVATATVSLDRGLLVGLYDHTIAAGEPGAPAAGALFRSTVNGKLYQRLADGSTWALNNEDDEYGSGQLPTADPAVAGKLWVDTAAGFVVKESQG